MHDYSKRESLYAIEINRRAALQLRNPAVGLTDPILVLIEHIATDTYTKQ